MSSNQKQAPTVVPQNQPRFPPGPYMTSRPLTPQQRPEQFHVNNPQQSFVPNQQPTPSANQGPGIRAMAQPGPPTQASTPPNTDIKVPPLPPQPNINLQPYVQPQRQNQNYYRGPNPTSQATRMTNRPAHQFLPSPQMSYMQPSASPYFYNAPMVMYNSSQQRPPAANFAPQNYSIITGQPVTFSFPPQPQAAQYFQYSPQQISTLPRQVASQQVPIPTQTPIPPAQTMSMSQNIPHAQAKRKDRPNAIAIVDPSTGRVVNPSDKENADSGESPEQQTPPPNSHNKDIQATFAKQVAQAALNEPPLDDSEPTLSHELHIENPVCIPTFQGSREHLAQSSKLQPTIKEFIPSTTPSSTGSSTSKETPVVSAITDAVEVTVKPKEKESPIKTNKQRHRDIKPREQHVETKQEVPVKEQPAPEKVKEEPKQKEVVAASAPAPKEKETSVPIVRETRDEKRNQKKEKSDPKQIPSAPSNVASETTPESVPVVANPAPTESGKSKSQKKDPPKQTPPPQQPQQQPQQPPQAAAPPQPQKPVPTIPVPQTQPAKPNNKRNRVQDINNKGATKEGTDMDAIFDTKVSNDNNSNVNSTTNSVANANSVDIINANSVVSTNNNNEIKQETVNNEKATIKIDYKPILPKGKCVTDIVKDIPKPIKIAPPVEAQDEPDRAGVANDKLVQAKNEANSKANLENDSNLDNKMNLPYKKDQWAPFNPTGKKVYDRDFLLALKDFPKSKQRPDIVIINEVVAADDKARDFKYPVGNRPDFAPNFPGGNYSGKSGSQRMANSSKGRQAGGKGSLSGPNKGSKVNPPRVSITLKENVKLHETENAWKPARFIKSENMTDEEKKTEALYKAFRGILNKLTPQKFGNLLEQVRELTIDTTERLQGVIDLVFAKAVDEPNFSEAYSNLCKELAMLAVPANKKGEKSEKAEEFINFRKLLVMRCQYEFENSDMDAAEKSKRQKDIDACPDPEKRREMTLMLEEDERKIRRKSVGTTRFLGELFKQQMLTVNIIQRCLNNLLNSGDEENLECLCKLLATVGREMEVVKNIDLTNIFKAMADIAQKSNPYKISSRVRFMLQDTIDLRNHRWVPRRQDLNPKTIDQIQKEAENEQMNIQVMNSGPLPPRKDDRGNSGPNSERKGRRNANVTNEDGWTTASRNNRASSSFTVQSDKLKIKSPQIDEPLGSSNTFGGWARGSNINKPPVTVPATNIYSCLDNNLDSDRRLLGSRPSSSRDPSSYSSKGSSMERSYKQYDGRGSRSGSQHRSNDNNRPTLGATPVPKMSAPMPSTNMGPPPSQPPPAEPTPASVSDELTDLQIRWAENTIEEYLTDCSTIEEVQEDMLDKLEKPVLPAFVERSCMYVLEKAKIPRMRTGQLFVRLITNQAISLDDYCKGLELIVMQASDLMIDVPKCWDYLAEVLFYVVVDVLPLRRFAEVLEPIKNEGIGSKLMAPLFKLIVEDKGVNYLSHIWQQAEVALTDFMQENEIERFIAENGFDFLVNANAQPSQPSLSYDEIHEALTRFLKNKEPIDVITTWITSNVGEREKENQFIRTLATAIFEDSIRNLTYCPDILKSHYNLIMKYVDNNQEYEMQYIIALQMLIHKLEHPKGVLLGIVQDLYDDCIISQESFIQWQITRPTDPAEMEGKGVALAQLNQFFFNISQEMSDGSDEP